MDKIVKVPENVSGVKDGVEAMATCAMSRFRMNRFGEPISLDGMPTKHPCKLMASFERGTVSISAHGTGVMLTVRMEDILTIIQTACEERA